MDGGDQHLLDVLEGAEAVDGDPVADLAGEAGVEKALGNLKIEIERDMKLMGVKRVSQLTRDMLRYR